MTTRIGFFVGLLFTLGFVTMLSASPVENVEEHFMRSDRDGSGGLSKAEIGGYSWGRYDTDGDGTVSRAEFIAGRNADRQQAAEAGRTERAWDLLDWNQDGFLSGTELDGKWERYDADGNGRVTKQEFLGAAPGNNPVPGNVPPPADNVNPPAAGKSLWGKSLAEAKKSDLFTFFRLQPLPGGNPVFESGTRHDFRPSAPAFRDLVLVQVLVDNQQRIARADLFLARSFIDDPKNGTFARDIAKSFLSQMTPEADQRAVQNLMNEIQFGGATNRVFAVPVPQLPNPPTATYQAFLGQREIVEQKLTIAQLTVRNTPDDGEKLIVITIEPKTSDEPRS